MAKLHSSIVLWPLVFIGSAFAIDALQASLPFLPADIVNAIPTANLSIFSYYALSTGLLAGLASVLTGIFEASRLVAKQGGIFNADKTIKPKVKTLVAHAGLNDIVLLCCAKYWYTRRETGAADFVPEQWMIGASFALVGVQLFAANLGSNLAHSNSKSKNKSQ